MNRRSFISLTAAATAAATLPINTLLSQEKKKVQGGPAQFDDGCTARNFLKFFQDPYDYKWVEAGMRPLCEPRKYDFDPRSRCYAFLPKDFRRERKQFNLYEESQPCQLGFRCEPSQGLDSYVLVPWIEVWGKSAREVYLAKQKMLVALLTASATAQFRSSSGEPWWKVEVFRDHVADVDHRLKAMGFPKQRQILVNSPGEGSETCDMIVEALEVIHLISNSSTAVMGCEACPPNTMFITAGNEWVGAFEQCSYTFDGKFISHVNMAILNDYAVTKVEF